MNGVFLLASLALLVNISFAAIEGCGSTGRACVDGQSSCVDGQCVCNDPNDWGNPAFACYKPDTYVAEIFNDPQLRNFNNESVQFPYPCRYLATHFMSELQDGESNVIGNCEFMVSIGPVLHQLRVELY
ncbi:hypothetical protein ElyMa_003639200 [Elysia marginata]|uniref:EB domain-containing protein n=1 Tax=Elysia marginata TaxID=1093978 RepID=A0AAV4EVJ3_9GAST|nr:hypothetical protein ElyMa_003639200 [Elysia marginata]